MLAAALGGQVLAATGTGAAGVTITAGTPQEFTSRNVGVELKVTPTVEEDNYSGKGVEDTTAQLRLQTTRIPDSVQAWSASGLAAVWARANTRAEIFAALERKVHALQRENFDLSKRIGLERDRFSQQLEQERAQYGQQLRTLVSSQCDPSWEPGPGAHMHGRARAAQDACPPSTVAASVAVAVALLVDC